MLSTSYFFASSMPTIAYSRVISLSYSIHPQIPLWPGDPQTRFSTVATWDRDGYFLRELAIGEHSATHINAPRSFDPAGWDVASIPPEQLILPAVCLDVRDRCRANRDYQIQIADLERWEQQYGQIPSGALVIAYTGWQEKWLNSVDFLGNGDRQGQLHFPGFAEDTAEFLIQQRQSAGVGIDTHGVDPGTSETFGVNCRILANDGIVLECLTQLNQLPAMGSTVIIGVLPLVDGSGSPAQVLALLP
ncbi:MAG: cyclase family protein [Cyanobacteria bacterium P01_D01_bin.73]